MQIFNQVHTSDALTLLRQMPDACVQTVITSPPYLGQRDYGHPAQIGLETDYREYVAGLVEIFSEARRVLRDDGTLWLNIGDTYVGATSQHREGGSQGHNSAYSRRHMQGIPDTAGERATAPFIKPVCR